LRQTSTLSHHTPIAGNILIAAFQNPTATTEVQKDFLATKRKVLNNNRLIKPFTLCFLTSILLGELFPSHQQDQSNPEFLLEEEGDNHLTS